VSIRPNEFPVPSATISISLHFEHLSLQVNTYHLDGGDAMAKADVIDSLVQRVLSEWPTLVYSDQIKKLVRKQ
jgi:hypothetical protein